MSQQSIEEKAARLVVEGRVVIHRKTADAVLASVRGDTGNRLVAWDGPHGWACMCPAKGTCSHIRAVSLFLTKGENMTTEPIDEIPETEEVGPRDEITTVDNRRAHEEEPFDERVGPGRQLATTDTETPPELLPLASTDISYQTLKAISQTEFVPASLRGRPEALLACVLYGNELGMPPMQSLSHIDVIDGRPTPSAEVLNMLIRAAGHTIEVIESTNKICRLKGIREDGEAHELSFSFEDAARAGLTSRPAWKAYPEDMLWARTISRLQKRLFPDVGIASQAESNLAVRRMVDGSTAHKANES